MPVDPDPQDASEVVPAVADNDAGVVFGDAGHIFAQVLPIVRPNDEADEKLVQCRKSRFDKCRRLAQSLKDLDFDWASVAIPAFFAGIATLTTAWQADMKFDTDKGAAFYMMGCGLTVAGLVGWLAARHYRSKSLTQVADEMLEQLPNFTERI